MSVITTIISNEPAMLAFGAKLAKVCEGSEIIFFYGNLGAGKTTLVRGFIRGLGFTGAVKSPTYTLVEPYEFSNYKVFHFDFYRVQDAQELEFMGIQDYFTPDVICLIEWPEIALNVLPPPDLTCYIEGYQEGRKIKLEAHSAAGKKILERLG
jgi:tRNA threonylcarbamoyladenosine biosynthesis protein TsaE